VSLLVKKNCIGNHVKALICTSV